MDFSTPRTWRGSREKLLLGLLLAGLALGARADQIDNIGVAPVEVPDALPGTATTESYLDFDSWAAAAGGMLASNRYADLGPGVLVTDQYAWTGAMYQDQDDFTLPYSYSSDGMILKGVDRIHILFTTQITAIGVYYPGALRIIGYLGQDLVFTSDDFGHTGRGYFAGVICDTPFDRVEILDWWDDRVHPDDIYFSDSATTRVAKATWGEIKALF